MQYLKNILFALAVGGISGFLNRGGMAAFASLQQPPLSPPGWLFPVVWTILYVLMSVSLTLVQQTAPTRRRRTAQRLYYLQLFFNFLWPFLFFGLSQYWAAFFWLVALLILVIWTTVAFWRLSPLAGLLMLPYCVWLLFAGYLNLAIAILNG